MPVTSAVMTICPEDRVTLSKAAGSPSRTICFRITLSGLRDFPPGTETMLFLLSR